MTTPTITDSGETTSYTGETRYYATARVDGEGRYGFVSATFWGSESAEAAEAGAFERLELERTREAKEAAKRAETERLSAPFRSAAMRMALDKSGPAKITPTPTNMLVGDPVWVWGHGSWRHGVAVWLSPTGKVARVLYFTPSGMVEHLTRTNEFYR